MKLAISGKGGVGKSTVAGTLARLYAADGHRVLAVDADPDANLASAIGLPLSRRSEIHTISTERKLIEDYEAMLEEVLGKLSPENHHLAVGLAVIPEKIRGFGHVKQRHLTAKADEAALLEQFRTGAPVLLKAAE